MKFILELDLNDAIARRALRAFTAEVDAAVAERAAASGGRTSVSALVKQTFDVAAPELQYVERAALLAAQAQAEPTLAAVFGGADPLADAPSPADAAASASVPEVPQASSTASVPDAPSVPTPPAAGATPAPAERDSTGLVWDERIHAGNRSKNKDGSWRAKRGVSDLLVTQVTQELRAIDGAAALSNPQPSGASVPTPPLPDAATPTLTFGIVVKHVQDAITAGRLLQSALPGMLAKHGLTSLPEMASRPDLWPAFYAEIPGA